MSNANDKKPNVYGVWGAVVADEEKAGFSPPLRSFQRPSGAPPTEMEDGSKTVWEVFEKSVESCGQRNCFGRREILKRDLVPSPDGKKQFEKFDMSDSFIFSSYSKTKERVEKYAYGMCSELKLKEKDKVLIFAETQAGWMETALACWRQNAVVVTAYATLGKDGVCSAVNQAKCSICVCDAKLFEVVRASASSCPTLKSVIVIPTKVDQVSVAEMQKSLPEGVEVTSMEDLITKGTTPVPPNPAAPDDIAVLMYTSGTTGNAKGVITSHANVVSTVRSAHDFFDVIDKNSIACAYLPLAHIMELVIEITVISQGGCIGYGNAGTLTDTGLKLNKGQLGDGKILKPNIIVFAPAVLDRIYSGVMDKIRGTGFKETVFMKALANGNANYDNGGIGANCCYNKLFQSAVQSLMGGNIKAILCGSAPLSAEIQKFAQTAFNCSVRQGYGLTETCAASCVGHQTDNDIETVGGPIPATIIRLRDWPEGNYSNADLNNPDIGMRRGEVLIGGPGVSRGYWIDETNPDADVVKKNEEDWVTVDGVRYFCSGDIGAITKKGQLKIVDRKKDLFKGAAGEYVSLSKVEALLKLSEYVEMPMAYGRTGAKGIIAMVVPKKAGIKKLAEQYKFEVSNNFDELVKKKEIIDEIFKSLIGPCKKGGLAGFEMPTAVALCIMPNGDPAWTPENENLTTTMKLKRPVIAKNFQSQIDAAYDRIA